MGRIVTAEGGRMKREDLQGKQANELNGATQCGTGL